jgi:outer membrane receptor protein involved in Fe transport
VIDASLFIRRGTELIDWTKPASTPTAQWRSTNLETATFRGAEFEMSITELLGIGWRVRATGLRISSTDADTLIGKYALSPLTETASLEATTPALMGVRVTVNTGRARRAREPEYWRTDLKATRSVGGRWTIRLDGLNLSDAEYRDASARPVAGRILLLGVQRGT